MATVTPLFNPEQGVLNVVGLMSGSGSNLRKILEHQHKLEKEHEAGSPFRMVGIFTDKPDDPDCKFREIANDYRITPFYHGDIHQFYKDRGHDTIKDMDVRAEYDQRTYDHIQKLGRGLGGLEIHGVMLGGYMSLITPVIFDNFLTVNVHPADLSIMDNGERKYRGDKVVRDAILAGEETVASTTHIADKEPDKGPILMISSPMPVDLYGNTLDQLKADEGLAKEVADKNQDKLKEEGDWVIFPKTVEDVARGLFGQDESGAIYHREKPGAEWVKGHVRL